MTIVAILTRLLTLILTVNFVTSLFYLLRDNIER